MTAVADELKIFTADGFDEALIGSAFIHELGQPVAVYDRSKCIDVLVERDGMSYEDAEEFFEYNVAGACFGPGTPIYVEPHTMEQLHELAESLN